MTTDRRWWIPGSKIDRVVSPCQDRLEKNEYMIAGRALFCLKSGKVVIKPILKQVSENCFACISDNNVMIASTPELAYSYWRDQEDFYYDCVSMQKCDHIDGKPVSFWKRVVSYFPF